MNMATTCASKGRKIGYARVSTSSQNLKQQIVALRAAGCHDLFIDRGVSGKSAKRKGLRNAMNALGEGDTLVVHKLDRLGRSVLLLAKLLSQFEAKGATFQSLNLTMDTTTASGKLVYFIFAAFAEFESNLNGERTKGGMKIRKADGVHVSRPPKLSIEDAQTAHDMLNDPDISLTTATCLFNVSPSTLKRLEEKNAA